VRTYADNNLDLFNWLRNTAYAGGLSPNLIARSLPHTAQRVHWPNEVTGPRAGRPSGRSRRPRGDGRRDLLQQQMTKIHRESPTAGRITGIEIVDVDNNHARHTPDEHPRA
jgi:hypothetical protein